MLKVSLQMPAVQLGDIVQFGNWKPARVVEHLSCEACGLRLPCREEHCPTLCYMVSAPEKIMFEVL